MIGPRLFCFVLSLFLPSTLVGGEVARWEAAASAKADGIQLERAVDSEWHIERTGAWEVARLKPSSDYYTRAGYHLTLAPPSTGKLWLILEFLDRGYGLITLSPGVPETRQWSVARVNTGRIRRSVFHYAAILSKIEKHGLQWFPMLLAGSGYALPAWLYESTNNVGFKCLEHGIVHDTQSIFHPFQTEYASRFIAEFGKHYGHRKSLLGIRLGPSGDYGEAQYPAKGPGYGFRQGHTHIGYWAGDDFAQAAFRGHLKKKYGDVSRLNAAWDSRYEGFGQINTFLPETAVTRRKRLDFADWYMGAMSEWCEQWALWSRQALPHTVIHQSSGGWGPVQIGTDYSRQARSMAKIHGGLRLTNKGDDFPDNFTITRMASSAARFYGIPLGYEPGGFGSKRGVMARLFNAVTTGAVHL